ncbi:MAG: carboxypeptidase regulatory-like domain-containing protein [Gemmatimonadaceae bacterium]
MSRRILSIVVASLFAVAAITSQATAQGLDVIRGVITGPDNAPIENANITATSVQGNVNRTARTDKGGRFTITFPGGEGDYFVNIAALGFAPRRFEVKRTADQDILVADARLQRMVLLDTMKATAERGRVNRNDKAGDVSGSEIAANAAAVSAAQQGDLNAMAASIPGVTPVTGADGDPAGFSVLGLSADQNSTTLNGQNFGSSNIPRDAQVSSSLITTPYDVSRGGFSGGQFNINSGSGSNFIRRTGSLNVDSPKLQWTDPTARALGQQYSNLSLGGALSGPIVMDKAYYSVSYQLGRRANDLQTLMNTDPSGLQATGVSADSIARLLQLTQSANIPSSISGGIPNDKLQDQGAVFGSLNFTPPGSTSGQTFSTTFNGNWNRQTPVGQLTGELPAHSGDRTNFGGGVQGSHTSYIRNVVLSESGINLNYNRNYGTPYTLLPNGSVLINSTFADGTGAQRTIGFGGNSSLSTESRNLSIGATNQLSWFSKDNKHRLKLASEVRRDGYEQNQTTNSLGSFFFNSLADLQANRPAVYTRTLSPRLQSASQTVGAISLGDSWKKSSDFQLQYGLRVDGNHYSATPTFNSAVQQAFGVRNDVVPNKLYLSPRMGFSWTYGEAPQIAAFDGAVRGPRAVVRGGIGVFQNMPGATLLGGAIDNTGLPSGLQQLSCVGPAAPAPQWSQYAADPNSIPTTCADGTSGTVFASNAPNVTMFSKDYQERRSVRGNIQWNGPVLNNRFVTTVDATYGVNMNQGSFIDLNFANSAKFNLADEGGRPIFANVSSIVPTTGAIAVRDAKVNSAFNRVTQLTSDLRSNSKQLRVSVSPTNFSSNLTWNASYVLADNREQVRGFSSTSGDPLSVEWTRSQFDSRHQITYTIGYNFFDAVRVNWFGRFASGSTFTPQLSGDVNGDGYTNDRAYVFNPANAYDPAVGAGISELLKNGSASAKECLSSQLGKLAQRNSCQGPWTSNANLSISFNPMKVRMPQRATLSFSVSNPLGAADILLHGEDKLHGWGQFAFADPTLYYVRGFDPATKRYKYEVNPRFGSTNPQFQTFRAPVTLTMQIRVDVGPSRERQLLTQRLDMGRARDGQKMSEQMVKLMYGTGGVMNPMAQLLRQSDTLQLTGPQADSLATMNRAYTLRLDSIWTPVAKEFAALPANYDQGTAYDHYKHAREATVDLLIALAPRINALISADQKRKLPALVASHLDERYLAGIRSGTAGNTGGGVFMGGFMGGGFGGGGGGGGGERIIIRGGP